MEISIAQNLLIHRFTSYTHMNNILYYIVMSMQKYFNLFIQGTDIIRSLVCLPVILIMLQDILNELYNIALAVGLVLDITLI